MTQSSSILYEAKPSSFTAAQENLPELLCRIYEAQKLYISSLTTYVLLPGSCETYPISFVMSRCLDFLTLFFHAIYHMWP